MLLYVLLDHCCLQTFKDVLNDVLQLVSAMHSAQYVKTASSRQDAVFVGLPSPDITVTSVTENY